MSSSSVPESVPKRILKSKSFKGHFQEKRLCPELQKYKDVIVVRASEEPNLALDFALVLDLLATSTKWVGLTVDDSKDFVIWTDLDDGDMPFGEYYFEIKTVRSSDTELQLKLRVQDQKKNLSRNGEGFDLSTVNWSDYEPKKILNAVLGWIVSIRWNWGAIKQTMEFIVITLVYFFTEIPNMISFVGEFTLRAFREFSNLIHVLTPIFMAIIDMCSKIFGVLFMLISDILRSSKNNNRRAQQEALQQQQHYQQIDYR